jgi:hypothetical protein
VSQRTLTAAALGFLVVLTPTVARAQAYVRPSTNPFQTPAVSPYLNLARGGNPAINYYGVVRPQTQYGQSILQLQQQVAATQGVTATEAALALPTTGHPTRFFNYSHYFFSQGGAGLYGAGAAAPFAPYGAGLANPWAANFPPRTGLGAFGRPVR